MSETYERRARRRHTPRILVALAATAIAACGGGAQGDGGASAGADDAIAGDGGGAVACDAGARVCEGADTFAVCAADGDGFGEPIGCPEGQGCEDGACRAQVCAPGATVGACASESAHERCNAGGTGYELVTCEPGTSCAQGRCAGQVCAPGTRICAGFTRVRECAEDGSGFVDAGTCPPGGVCDDGECLDPCDVNIKAGSYLGCEYWPVHLDNVEEALDKRVGVVVSVPADNARTEVTLRRVRDGERLSAAELEVSDLFVSPGELEIFLLPEGHRVEGSGVTRDAFRLTTDAPVTVHQFNPLQGEAVFSNDASLLLPSAVMSGDYIVMSWPHREDTIATLRGFVNVVATRPGETTVHVTPSTAVQAGVGVAPIAAGYTQSFLLDEGDMLNLASDSGEGGGDLTGTRIIADQPVNVIAGHQCANVPVGISACDHVEQQLIPRNDWGIRYVVASFAARSPSQVDIVRVMGGANGVTVTTDPPVPGFERFELQLGTWVQFSVDASVSIDADGPIQVGHFLTGANYPGADRVCGDPDGVRTGLGDPAFTIGVPTNRYLSSYVVLTPSGYRDNYVNVVAPPGAAITIDGAPLQAPLEPIGDSGWAVARQRVDAGVHEIAGDEPFGLTVYGYDCEVSYAYPGGLRLQPPKER